MNEQTNEGSNKRTNERRNEQTTNKRMNERMCIFLTAAPSYKKFIQLYFKHPGTPFSMAIFPFERPIATRRILMLGLYHLGHHGNFYVSIGPSFNGIPCSGRTNFENLEIVRAYNNNHVRS